VQTPTSAALVYMMYAYWVN